jgi:hypothetical protein
MNGKADEDDPFVQEVNTAVELKRGVRQFGVSNIAG